MKEFMKWVVAVLARLSPIKGVVKNRGVVVAASGWCDMKKLLLLSWSCENLMCRLCPKISIRVPRICIRPADGFHNHVHPKYSVIPYRHNNSHDINT